MITLHFKGQDYKRLKIKCNLKNLFVDPIFKADRQSLFYNEHGRFKKSMDSQLIEWLRPEEICKMMNLPRPKFDFDGFSNLGVKQEYFENRWLIEGVNSIAENETLLAQVIPSNQSFDSEYAGNTYLTLQLT